MLGFCFLVFFGACQGLVHLVFFWCLPMFGGFDLSKYWQAQKKTKHNLTKHWQAPKKKTQSQRLLRTLDPHRLEICFYFGPANVL